MTFGRLILTNLRRHRMRAAFGVAGIAFGVGAMLTVLTVATGAIGMFQDILSTDTQFLVFERNVSDLFFSSVPETAIEAVRKMPGVADAHPVLFGIVQSEGHPVVTCFGVEAGNPRVQQARWIKGDPQRFGLEADSVYLGRRAAEFLHASMGDDVQIGRETFRVAGVLQTRNGFEDGGVFMPLPEAQAYFHREHLASIVAVNLVDPDGADAFRQQVERQFPDLTALASQDFNNSYSQFRILKATSWAIGLCAFLLGGLSVANTMTMSVFTRIREIAVLRVCGFSRRQMAGIVLGEGAVMAIVGVAVGSLAGLALLRVLQAMPQLQGYVRADVSAGLVGGVAVTAMLTSMVGSIYPAWHACRIQPAEALRYE